MKTKIALWPIDLACCCGDPCGVQILHISWTALNEDILSSFKVPLFIHSVTHDLLGYAEINFPSSPDP